MWRMIPNSSYYLTKFTNVVTEKLSTLTHKVDQKVGSICPSCIALIGSQLVRVAV